MSINQRLENEANGKRIHHPVAADCLALLAQKTKFNRQALPQRSIVDALRRADDARVLADAKAFTPGQVEALERVQAILQDMVVMATYINKDNIENKLGLPSLMAVLESELLAGVDERIRLVRRFAKEKGIPAVLDNRYGAEQAAAAREPSAMQKRLQAMAQEFRNQYGLNRWNQPEQQAQQAQQGAAK